MTILNIQVLKRRILDVFALKSQKKLKEKIKKFKTLKSFIVICSPFIFSNIFIKEKKKEKFYIHEIIVFLKKNLKTIQLIFNYLLNQIFIKQIKFENKIFFFFK